MEADISQEDDTIKDEAGEEAVAPEETSGGAVLASLPVRIDFHVGEISVPAAKLSELSEGYCFPKLDGAGFPLARAVCGGKTFAEGELVEVDGAVGFRITRLLD